MRLEIRVFFFSFGCIAKTHLRMRKIPYFYMPLFFIFTFVVVVVDIVGFSLKAFFFNVCVCACVRFCF